MGSGTLRRNEDPESHGLPVYDTRRTADTMKIVVYRFAYYGYYGYSRI